MTSFFNRSWSRLNRREFVARTSAALACATVLPSGHAFADSSNTDFVEVNTACGRVRGMKTAGLVTFKGIPYAGSVSGAGRFKAAPPLQPWTGVRDALQLGAPALQPGGQRRNRAARRTKTVSS